MYCSLQPLQGAVARYEAEVAELTTRINTTKEEMLALFEAGVTAGHVIHVRACPVCYPISAMHVSASSC
jgi:hypothetical protein